MSDKTQKLCVRAIRAALLGCTLIAFLPVAHAQQETAQEPLKEVQLANDRFMRGTPVPAWVEKAVELPHTRHKHPVVFLLSDTQYLANAQNSTYIHRAWQINDTSALGQFSQYPIGFQANYQQLQLHWLRIRRNGQMLDQTHKAKIRFLQREHRLEQGIYDGEVTASILIEDLRVGDILEVAYTWDGDNPVFKGKLSDFAGWDYTVPTELRRVVFSHAVDRPIQWRMLGELGRNVPTPTESVAHGMRKLRWEERDMEPLLSEESVPDSFFAARVLQISDYGSWAEVADWARQLFDSNEPLTGELQTLVQRLRTLPTAEQKASAALSWVQKEIRYFSVALGESSHRPHAPNQTLARRYGDCKDKTFLLIELLRALGVPAQPVLLSTRTRTAAAKLLPTPHAFDHAIVRVQIGERTYFLDPTLSGQAGKLDRMGQPHEGSQVLVAEAGNNSLTVIASPDSAAIARNELRETIHLPKFGGEGTLETRQVWNGTPAEYMRLNWVQAMREQLEKALMEPYENRYPGINRAAPMVIEDDPENNVLAITNSYRIPKLAVSGNGDWGIRVGTTNMRGSLRSPPSANRTQPLALDPLLRTMQYDLSIEFPSEVSVITDPTSSTVSNPAFDFTIGYTFRGNRATAAATLRTLQPEVQARDTEAYMAALRRVQDVTRSFFVVRKGEIKANGIFGLGAKTLQQSLQDRINERIERISKVIDSGKLTGDDLAGAYCSRAQAYLDVNKGSEGMKDAQLAVKAAPNVADNYRCRASAWFLQGDYARSVADYNQSITLGGADFATYYRRGQSRFYAGQLQAALTDFTEAYNISSKSSDENNDHDDTIYAELWRVWTQMRLGLSPAESQRKFAAENRRGNWPRPALAMLHGQLSVENVLERIEGSKKGDDKELALAEAYFYIGQHYFAQGDKTRAIDYFKKTREKGITMFIEHVSAGAELQQLGAKTE